MSTKKVLFIVFASNLLLLAGLFGMLYLARGAHALPPAQPQEVQMASASAWDSDLYPQVPSKMMYQGVLRDSSGTPIDGTHTLTFTLETCDPFCWDAWNEVHASVPITNGLFSVVLGETTPLTPGLFTGYTGWDLMYGDLPSVNLAVNVDGEDLTPWSEMVAVPYAFRAEYVNRFPAPHYDSGWYAMIGSAHTFNHNLGGNTDDYIVDMQFKDGVADPWDYGVHQTFYGLDYDNNGASIKGMYWDNLTSTSIGVTIGANETDINYVRIRIWRTD